MITLPTESEIYDALMSTNYYDRLSIENSFVTLEDVSNTLNPKSNVLTGYTSFSYYDEDYEEYSYTTIRWVVKGKSRNFEFDSEVGGFEDELECEKYIISIDNSLTKY